MKKTILLLPMLLPFFVISQNITSITPNQASQGQTIPLMISGNNTDFSGWSCINPTGSNWGSISDFRFFQAGGMNMMNGTPTTSSINLLNGTLTIPQFQPIGAYTLEVFDGNACSWLQLPFGFQVNLATSIEEHTTNKELLKVTDLLGREANETNQPIFYIYDDGTVEKRIVIE